MSALDRMFKKEPSDKPANALGALGSLLSSVIPASALEEMTINVGNLVQYFKTNTDLSVKQGALILEQQALIMKHLGIENVGNGNSDGGTGSAGNAD